MRIVNNAVRYTLGDAHIDITDDTISVSNSIQKITIKKSDVIRIKANIMHNQTKANNITVGARVIPNIYISKEIDIGSKKSIAGLLNIYYRDKGVETLINIHSSDGSDTNGMSTVLNYWLGGRGGVIPSKMIKDSKTLSARINHYLPTVVFILFWVWLIYKFNTAN